MTTYYTNFGSYTAAAQPSDMTARWVTSNVTWLTTTVANTESGKALEKISTADARRLLSWDTVSAHADSEGLMRFKVGTVGGSALLQTYLHLRGSGAAAAETSYWAAFSATSSGSLQLGKWVSGTATNLGTAYAGIDFVASVWYWMRFRVNGTTLSARIWKDGEQEPTVWHTTATDSAVTAAGWVGVGNFESTGTLDVDYLAFGTAGDTAPLHSSTTTTERISQAVMEVANVGTASAVLSQAVMEVANVGTASALTSQMVVEIALGASPTVQISQMVVEIAVSNVAATVQQPRVIVLM